MSKVSFGRVVVGIGAWLGVSYAGASYLPVKLWYMSGILGFVSMILIIYFYEVRALIKRLLK